MLIIKNSVKIKELLDIINWKGFEEAIFLGISECEELGKNFIGVTLSNGDGLVLSVDPYQEEVNSLFLYTNRKIEDKNLKLVGFFKPSNSGNTYYLYVIDNLKDFVKEYEKTEVVSVEVIQGELEDFLYSSMA